MEAPDKMLKSERKRRDIIYKSICRDLKRFLGDEYEKSGAADIDEFFNMKWLFDDPEELNSIELKLLT